MSRAATPLTSADGAHKAIDVAAKAAIEDRDICWRAPSARPAAKKGVSGRETARSARSEPDRDDDRGDRIEMENAATRVPTTRSVESQMNGRPDAIRLSRQRSRVRTVVMYAEHRAAAARR